VLTPGSILETHDKTILVLASFLITVGGWWAWNAFLSAVYQPGVSPYAVRDGFNSGFGSHPAWWLTLVVALAILGAAELGYKAVKRQVVAMGSGDGIFLRGPLRLFGRLTSGGRQGRPAGKEDLGLECNVGLWQEMEKHPIVREQLKSTVGSPADL